MTYNIYRFTNSKGLVNYGVILERVGSGANVLMDQFATSDKNTIPARYAYISFEDNPYVDAKTKHDVLPLDHPVSWVESEIQDVIAVMRYGNFGNWWQENQSRIIKKFIGGYKKEG